MPRFSIASERVIELCAQARKELERRKPQPRAGMVLHYEVQAYFPEDAELKLYALEHAAKQAIKLAGQGQSQVLIDQADEAILLDLLPHAKKA